MMSRRRLPARGRPLHERHQAGRDDRDLRRGRLDGPAHRGDAGAAPREQGDLKYPITWSTLHEGMLDLEKRGVSPNVASFIGAATLREYVIGLDDKRPTPDAAADDARSGGSRDEGGRARHRVGADLRAGFLREDRRADRDLEGRRRSTRACTSRTCAARAIVSSKRSKS